MVIDMFVCVIKKVLLEVSTLYVRHAQMFFLYLIGTVLSIFSFLKHELNLLMYLYFSVLFLIWLGLG